MTCSRRMERRRTWQKAESGFCISRLQAISIAPRVCWRVLVYSHVAFANGKRKIHTASRSSLVSASRLSQGIIFVWFMFHGGNHTALEAASPLRTLHIHNHKNVIPLSRLSPPPPRSLILVCQGGSHIAVEGSVAIERLRRNVSRRLPYHRESSSVVGEPAP